MSHLAPHELDEMAAGLMPADPHLEACAACAARWAERWAEREAFLSRNPPDVRAEELLSHRHRRPVWPWLLAACVTLAVLVIASRDSRPPILTKGTQPFSFIVSRDGKVATGKSGDVFRPGDVLQISVHGAKPHVTVFSLDARGAYGLLLDVDATGRLPSSFVLDDSPLPERLFVVFSQAPIDALSEKAQAALRGRDLEDLESFEVPGADVYSILVRKERHP